MGQNITLANLWRCLLLITQLVFILKDTQKFENRQLTMPYLLLTDVVRLRHPILHSNNGGGLFTLLAAAANGNFMYSALDEINVIYYQYTGQAEVMQRLLFAFPFLWTPH